VLQDPLVTARLELSRGGCLPGDTLTLQVSVQHVKPIKSLHGVIVTFYRQSRIDASPLPLPLPLPLPEHAAGGKTRVAAAAAAAASAAAAAAAASKESYYTKSKTGLASLSSSAPGGSRQYRMDLCQTLVPLIVDPVTLQATVRASIRVPDDIFPTIASVPGEMLSFRYYVEAALDLKGKLAGHDLSVMPLGQAPPPPSSSLSASSSMAAAEGGPLKGAGAGADVAGLSWTWAGSVVNTEKLRREKSLVVRVFEVTVGTRDSRRGRKRPNNIKPQHYYSAGGTGDADGRTGSYHQRRRPMPNQSELCGGAGGSPPGVDFVRDGPLHGHPYFAPNPETNNGNRLQQQLLPQHHYSSTINGHSFPTAASAQNNGSSTTDALLQQQQPACVPLPPPPPPSSLPLAADGEQEMDEKTRLRLAEERLLPSSPPAAAGPGPGSSSSFVAAGLSAAAADAAAAAAAPAALLAPPQPAPSAPFVPDCGDVDSLFGGGPGDDEEEGFGADDGAVAPQYVAAWSVPLSAPPPLPSLLPLATDGEEQGGNVVEVREEDGGGVQEEEEDEEEEGEGEDMRLPLAATTAATDDKQELERQRMLAMASSPAAAAAHHRHHHHHHHHLLPENSSSAAEVYDGGHGVGAESAALWAPSAPVLPEEEEVGRGDEVQSGTGDGGSGTSHNHNHSSPPAPHPTSASSSLLHPPLHPPPRYGEQ
jgi:hypothetical protein